MKKTLEAVLTVVLLVLAFAAGPAIRAFRNRYDYAVQKADDATNYRTLKEVEDTCRAMMASYEADKLTFEQYDGSDSAEKQSWADQARMRANRTAASYNEYIRKNSFVWADAVPADIDEKLDYIGGEHE